MGNVIHAYALQAKLLGAASKDLSDAIMEETLALMGCAQHLRAAHDVLNKRLGLSNSPPKSMNSMGSK